MAKLIYVIGASGVGKDALLSGLRQRFPHRLVAHRYITRCEASGEDHVPLTDAEFEYRRAAGLFCLDWQAHGLRYGVGIEICAWMSRGHDVVVNGSRAHLDTARHRFGIDLVPLLITADETVLQARLLSRGREEPSAIRARLDRNRRMTRQKPSDALCIDNSNSLASGVAALERALVAVAAQSESSVQ